MGFYIRKSISAGPFRFNLSGSGIGMSVGVKGFRVGSGPRGNYVHMGRGGFYYRASLGRHSHYSKRAEPKAPNNPTFSTAENAIPIETGNVSEMVPSNGSSLLGQINEKMSLWRIWPWVLVSGIIIQLIVASQTGDQRSGIPILFLTAVLGVAAWWWDKSRKAVVVMYDLSEEIAEKFRQFSNAFDHVGSASKIWNIDSSARTTDWKRNAGASRLVGRKVCSFIDALPSVLKTNVSVPCIKGGKQNIYFLPDCVLITEGQTAGAMTYDQLQIFWNTTVFIETDNVPSDSQVVGHTWRFVNKNGGPDRRFNNNKQIPEVRYQQMGLQGSSGFQKILHISRVEDRSDFDAALSGIRAQIADISTRGAAPAGPLLLTYDDGHAGSQNRNNIMLVGLSALTLAIAAALYFSAPPVFVTPAGNQEATVAQPAAVVAQPSTAPKPIIKAPEDAAESDELAGMTYREPGNLGNVNSDAAIVVTEFYRDLERSDGESAAAFVVAEKREAGPLSSTVLTAKYSDLQEPLHLDDVQIRSAADIFARYSYMPASGLKCVGIANVRTEKRGDEVLIASIRSREVCR